MRREGRVEPPTLARGPSGTGSKGIQIIPARPLVGNGARVPKAWDGVGGGSIHGGKIKVRQEQMNSFCV